MNILTKTLSVLHVPYTSSYANRIYEEHPNRGNLYGLSQLFLQYAISCQGVRLSNKSEIKHLPMPCIMHFSQDFVLVSKVSDSDVSIWWNGNQLHLSLEKFLSQWSGVALLLSRGVKAMETDYVQHLKNEAIRHTSTAICFLCFLCLVIMHALSSYGPECVWLFLPLFIFTLIGLISFMLVREQMHLNSPLVEAVCSSLSRGSCNNVLESKAAKLFGNISWSEIGLGFSIGSILCILVYTQHLTALLAFCACSLPYTVWSVWYQWRKVRSWCILCLVVQLLLWFQLSALFLVSIQLPSLLPLGWTSLLQVGLLLLGCILAVHWCVGIVTDALQLSEWKHSYRRLKANAKVFAALQESQQQLPTGPSKATAISFGQADAPHVLTVLTNPYCNPCAQMHQRLKRLNTSKVRIDYILSSFNADKETTSKLLIAAYQQLGPDRALAVFDAWFAGGREQGNDFFTSYHLDPETPDVLAQHHLHQQWREKTGIHATPTLLFDGKRFPDEYKLEDLDDLL